MWQVLRLRRIDSPLAIRAASHLSFPSTEGTDYGCSSAEGSGRFLEADMSKTAGALAESIKGFAKNEAYV
jgi:hypothetical protein